MDQQTNKFYEPNPRSSLPNISDNNLEPNFTKIKEERRNSLLMVHKQQQEQEQNDIFQSRNKSLPELYSPKMHDNNSKNKNNNGKKLSKTEKRRERSKEAILDIDLLRLILSFTQTRAQNALLSMDKSQKICQTNESHLMGFSFSLLNTNISHINLDIESLCLNVWHYNAAFGSVTDVQKLLQSRIPGMNDTDIKQRTALHYSISNKKYQIAQLLIESSCDVNKADYNGVTPIHLACALGNIPIYDLLVQYGADANKKNLYHDPPIYFAFLFGHTEMANHMMRRNSSYDSSYLLDGTESSEKSEGTTRDRSFSWESEDPEFHTFCFQSNPPEIFLYYFTTPNTPKQEFITSTDLFKLWLHSHPQSSEGKKKLKDKIRNYICCTPSLSRGQHKHIKYPEHATSTKILPLIESQCKHYSLEKISPTGWKLTLGSKASFVKQLFFDSANFRATDSKMHLVLKNSMWKCPQKWMNGDLSDIPSDSGMDDKEISQDNDIIITQTSTPTTISYPNKYMPPNNNTNNSLNLLNPPPNQIYNIKHYDHPPQNHTPQIHNNLPLTNNNINIPPKNLPSSSPTPILLNNQANNFSNQSSFSDNNLLYKNFNSNNNINNNNATPINPNTTNNHRNLPNYNPNIPPSNNGHPPTNHHNSPGFQRLDNINYPPNMPNHSNNVGGTPMMGSNLPNLLTGSYPIKNTLPTKLPMKSTTPPPNNINSNGSNNYYPPNRNQAMTPPLKSPIMPISLNTIKSPINLPQNINGLNSVNTSKYGNGNNLMNNNINTINHEEYNNNTNNTPNNNNNNINNNLNTNLLYSKNEDPQPIHLIRSNSGPNLPPSISPLNLPPSSKSPLPFNNGAKVQPLGTANINGEGITNPLIGNPTNNTKPVITEPVVIENIPSKKVKVEDTNSQNQNDESTEYSEEPQNNNNNNAKNNENPPSNNNELFHFAEALTNLSSANNDKKRKAAFDLKSINNDEDHYSFDEE